MRTETNDFDRHARSGKNTGVLILGYQRLPLTILRIVGCCTKRTLFVGWYLFMTVGSHRRIPNDQRHENSENGESDRNEGKDLSIVGCADRRRRRQRTRIELLNERNGNAIGELVGEGHDAVDERAALRVQPN